MNRPSRRSCLLMMAGLLVIALGILAVAYFARRWFTPVPTTVTPPPPVTEKIVVTSRGVQAGSVLTPDDLAYAQAPVELVPLSRLTDINAAVGKVAVMPMVAGEMVLPHHLFDTTNVVDRTLAFSIADDQVLMAFPIADLMSSINILKRGDVVDILASITQEVQPEEAVLTDQQETVEKLFTFDALQRVTITAIVVDIVEQQQETGGPLTGGQGAAQPTPSSGTATPQPPPEPSRQQTQPVALMLALAPQDALVLKHLKDDDAVFDLVLRSPTSTQLFETNPVTSEYIIERYQLQPRR